ncbi:MAG: hypothetical protein D6682_03010 [Zetaproteobacteria bacterium]|nr:MAG: hypothetical protein D6682_03010 [Zetaproteobacteria bacterium]
MIPVLLASGLILSGCVAGAAVSAVGAALSAVGGVVAERAARLAESKKVSLPMKMDRALAAVQRALRAMDFDVDLLQPTKEGGYIALFGNEKLDGSVTLERVTPVLTTYKVKVLDAGGLSRNEAVEEAVTNLVRNQSKKLGKRAHFDFRDYNVIRKRPNRASARVGWFRIGSRLRVRPATVPGWLQIEMPEGDKAFLKGKISETTRSHP